MNPPARFSLHDRLIVDRPDHPSILLYAPPKAPDHSLLRLRDNHILSGFKTRQRAVAGGGIPFRFQSFSLILASTAKGFSGLSSALPRGLAATRSSAASAFRGKRIDGSRETFEYDPPDLDLTGHDRLDLRLVVDIDLAAGRLGHLGLRPEGDLEGLLDRLLHRLQRDDAGLLQRGLQPAAETVVPVADRHDGVGGGQAGAGDELQRAGDRLELFGVAWRVVEMPLSGMS